MATLDWGFAKNRPAAQARDGPAARRPAANDGPAARSRFSTVFCPAVNPCACTGLHRVLGMQIVYGRRRV